MNKIEYKEYLRSSEWQVVRRIALEFADYRCQVCNFTKKLQVHNRSYQNIGAETLSDVIVLCDSCHFLFHGIPEKKVDKKKWGQAPTGQNGAPIAPQDLSGPDKCTANGVCHTSFVPQSLCMRESMILNAIPLKKGKWGHLLLLWQRRGLRPAPEKGRYHH